MQLNIPEKNVLIIGNFGHQNLGDELILIGNLRLLKDKNVYVISGNPKRLEQFCQKFIDTSNVTFIHDIPKGIRSLFAYIFKAHFFELINFFKAKAYIIGGGEILTNENPTSYIYWFISSFIGLISSKNFYIMGGFEAPNKWYNKIIMKLINLRIKKGFPRDYESKLQMQKYGMKVEKLGDTSFYTLSDRKEFDSKNKQKYIMINLNKKGEKFLPQISEDINKYANRGYTIFFAPISNGKYDDDTTYYDRLKEIYNEHQFHLIDRREDFFGFLKIIGECELVISTRLHLFLISKFIGTETKVYPYQNKIEKMQKEIG